MFVDTHIHLQDYKTQDVKNVVTNAAKNNVMCFINPSAHPCDWDVIESLARQYPEVTPAFGVHPWHTDDVLLNWEQHLETYVQNNPCAWIGECGIDRIKNSNISQQINVLKKHINLSHKHNRPLIIHAVKADTEMSALFPELPPRTIFHSFTGSAEWGKAIQKHGFFIGLNFSILRKKNAAEILRQLNLKQILLETDGPYQNYEKGVETLPQNIPLLARKIAELLQIPYIEFEQMIINNQTAFLGEK